MNEPIPEPDDPSRDPEVAPILRDALGLKDASLVLCRRKTIIEFKTERLGRGLQRYVEDGYTTWQVGEFRDHHCHLDLKSVTSVVFNAEPVSCQGGRLNYTVWFVVEWDCGNPFREGGYFSITLNGPYQSDGTEKRHHIDQVFDLFHKYREHSMVSAEPGFLDAMQEKRANAETHS